jgi:hypothetical protein
MKQELVKLQTQVEMLVSGEHEQFIIRQPVSGPTF